MESDATAAVEEAALSLSTELQHEPWYSTVGIGQAQDGSRTLIVYTKTESTARAKQLRTWKGYAVQLKRLNMRPARMAANPSLHSSETVPPHKWTNASVRKLMKMVGDFDPVRAVTHRAREIALDAMDRGWTGPPFDPLELADHLGIVVSPRHDIRDARTLSEQGRFRIEFNPNRPSARVRYSIAHEIAHTLFPDCAEQVRHRGLHDKLRGDDWQLEAMCNVGAAEMLMPLGSLKGVTESGLTIESLLMLRQRFEVSMEALLIRVVRLTKAPVAMFCASKPDGASDTSRFSLGYTISSQTWPLDEDLGQGPPANSVLAECTAIGYTTTAVETWGRARLRVEAVAIPPYPGSLFPRVVGILKQMEKAQGVGATSRLLRFVRGDALKPRGQGPRVLVHVVNDKTANWGGGGFAQAVKQRWPEIQSDFREWVSRGKENLTLGNVRTHRTSDGLIVASVVAQKGYGESVRPRIRYAPLRKGLEIVAEIAEKGQATVHMPRIGAGQGGGSWSIIEDIIQTVFGERGVSVTIYDIPGAPTPHRMPLQEELAFSQHS